MKNLLVCTVFIFISISLFSSNQSHDPQPYSGSGAHNAAMQSASISAAALKGGSTTPDKQPIPSQFEWKSMKTVTLPMYKGLNLTSPFEIVNEAAGDISWGSDGGCYSAIKCWKVSQAILKITDVKNITPEYLKTLSFVTGQVAWAPAGSTSWTNYMPVGTVIAYKTNLGKFQLVVVKNTSPLILEIFHENYYRIF